MRNVWLSQFTIYYSPFTSIDSTIDDYKPCQPYILNTTLYTIDYRPLTIDCGLSIINHLQIQYHCNILLKLLYLLWGKGGYFFNEPCIINCPYLIYQNITQLS